jgi:hypothetical protein
MQRFTFGLVMGVLAACTPPSIYREEKAPPRRGGVVEEPEPRGTGMGPASGPGGYAMFATPNEMYAALSDLLGAPIAQGARTYDVEVNPNPSTDEQARAVEVLRARAKRSAQRTARREGSTLLSVHFVSDPPAPGGEFILHVVSELQNADGERRREVRDALIVPRGADEVPDFTWISPPRPQ